MSFAVELSQETAPLTDQTLFNTLVWASSSSQQRIQAGTSQLQYWERQSEFYQRLQDQFLNLSLPFEVRYLAAIQLKNGIDKYWRKTAQNTIGKDVKQVIRQRCLQGGVNEPDHRLALQNAIIVAKVIRFEYPHDWPDALTSTTQILREAAEATATPSHLTRAFLMLLYIIKELSKAKLQRSRISLQEATPEILQVIGKIYVDKVARWLNFIKNGGDDEGGAVQSIADSLLAIRTIRRLIIAGYDHPCRNREVQDFWIVLQNQFRDMLPLVLNYGHSIANSIRLQIEMHLIQISKVHLEMARVHPSSFALLPDSLELAKSYWKLLVGFGHTYGTQTFEPAQIGTDGDAEDQVPCIEKLSLKSLLILRACARMVYSPAKTFKYQHVEDKEERQHSRDLIRTALLPEALIREMMEVLVTKFFVFRPRDLREWEEEPEEWERKEEGEGDIWEFSIRQCAEKLFLDLVVNNKQILIQPLLQVFYAVATSSNTDLLLKDSIYAAIGLAASVLENELDFGSFLENTLVAEIQSEQAGYNILRRRIAIILGQWMLVKQGLNRPLVYQIFQFLLDRDQKLNDEVVRVTAGRQLKNVIDPYEFTAEPFLPFATATLNRLMALIQEVELAETKLALLSTLDALVTRLEHQISPFAGQILSLLSPLWDQAGDVYLMKQAILGILSALVNSTGTASSEFHALILPLIESSVRIDSPTRPYLLDDALDLWETVLTQAPASDPSLLALASHLFPIYDTAGESLRAALDLTSSYIYLAPTAMLENPDAVLRALTALISPSLPREPTIKITTIISQLLRFAHEQGQEQAVHLLTTSIVNTGFLAKIVDGLKSAYAAHQTTGPNRQSTHVDGMIETEYLSVLARILISSPEVFVTAVLGGSEETASWLLTEWFSHMENVGMPMDRKLHCMALTSLLELGPQAWILGKLQVFMNLWSDVIYNIIDEPEEMGPGEDGLIWNKPESREEEWPVPAEVERRKNLDYVDPVHRVNVKAFVGEKLGKMIEACGGQQAFQQEWLLNVDQEVVLTFAKLNVL